MDLFDFQDWEEQRWRGTRGGQRHPEAAPGQYRGLHGREGVPRGADPEHPPPLPQRHPVQGGPRTKGQGKREK